MKEHLVLKGKYVAELVCPSTGAVRHRVEAANLITLEGQNHVARMLLDVASYDLGLTYQALGSSSVGPNVRDTQLMAEEVRRLVTSRPDTSGNLAAFQTFFPVSSLPAAIEEVGIFAHDATALVNTGVLFSRALLSIPSMGMDDLLLTYVLQVG